MLCCLLQQTLQQVDKLCPSRNREIGSCQQPQCPFAEPWVMLSWGQWGLELWGAPKHSPARAVLPAEHPTHHKFRAHSNLNYNYTYKYTDYNYLCCKYDHPVF